MLDVSMQHCGDAAVSFAAAQLNGLSLTSDLQPGSIITLPDVAVDKQAIADAFNMNALVPASAIPADTNEGIGFWIIEYDFIVN